MTQAMCTQVLKIVRDLLQGETPALTAIDAGNRAVVQMGLRSGSLAWALRPMIPDAEKLSPDQLEQAIRDAVEKLPP